MSKPDHIATPEEMATRRHSLWRAVLQLANEDDCERFFTDLCTPAEISDMADRWEVAQLVDRGLPYRQIHDETYVSTATITRVARSLHLGAGGYRAALDRSGKVRR